MWQLINVGYNYYMLSTRLFRPACSKIFALIAATMGLIFVNAQTSAIANDAFETLASDSCIHCHDGSQDNRLNMDELGTNLGDSKTFEMWERIHDRMAAGEMPPEEESRPDPALLKESLDKINSDLTRTNRRQQKQNGRTVMRRLTRAELQHTLNDLLLTHLDLNEILPPENGSSSFDTVASEQGLSPLHVRAYIDAADAAIEEAIKIGPEPESENRIHHFKEVKSTRNHLDKKNKNKDRVILLELDDSVVMFHTASYLFQLDNFHLTETGVYRIKATAASYQSDRPVIFTLNVGHYNKGYTKPVGFFDLQPKKPGSKTTTAKTEKAKSVTEESGPKEDSDQADNRPQDPEDRLGKFETFEVETVLRPGNYVFPGAMDVRVQPDGKTVWNVGPEDYTGSGIAIKSLEIEGPIYKSWPPESTTNYLQSVKMKKLDQRKWDPSRQTHIGYEMELPKNPRQALEEITAWLAPRAFRRPLRSGEGLPFVNVGMEALEQGRSFDEAVRLTGKTILTSPEFLFMSPEPGKLDHFSIATRLSYFLWKSIPDEQLFHLASGKKLDQPKVFKKQVDRMLDDPRADRFISDFCRQWLRLSEIDATSPDKALYPEFDDLLKTSMIDETESFIDHLFQQDLSSSNLIDSEFAFVNRRLAEHYDIEDVKGQHLQKVSLQSDSRRGGLMTQASVLKVTANGTNTSPVRRGAWVLTHLLGKPPSPPPPNVGSVEPDTRGTNTIRELLAKHRNDATCNACHRTIDPPGFALESFDVIGGFRTNYRTQENGQRPEEEFAGRKIWEYKIGLPVDASGQLPTGESFSDITQYKKMLLDRQEQVARNLIEKLIVYSTGTKIQFADRIEVERILNACKENDYGMKTMLYEIVASKIFQNK